MEYRQQRRALAAGRHVAPSKIGHHGNAGHFRQRVGIADLPTKGRRQIRAMTQCLAVTADGGHLAGTDACAAHQIKCGPYALTLN
jgi:hypothetical protein